MTTCNNYPYGCYQIKNSCNEKIWSLGTSKISENDNRCSNIKDLMDYEIFDYPQKIYESNILFIKGLGICILILVCYYCNKNRYESI